MQRMDAYLILARLRSAFPAAELPDETVELYAEFLERYDARGMLAAADDAILASRFFPTISELVDTYDALRPPAAGLAELEVPAASPEEARAAIDKIRAELQRARPKPMP